MPHQPHADPSAISIEMEIHALLLQLQVPDLVADELIQKYSNKKMKLEDFEILATFFLHCGFSATLADFIRKKIDDGSQIPWGHFAEAIYLSSLNFKPEIKRALIEGAEERKALMHLARSHALDDFDSSLEQQRNERRQNFFDQWIQKKHRMVDEINILSSQGLHREEEKLIQALSRMYPGDMDVSHLRSHLRLKLAQDYLLKRPAKQNQKVFLPLFEKKDPESEAILKEIEDAMFREVADNDLLADDFAVAHIAWENFEAALHILKKSADSPTRDWLKAEALFRCRRFGELLDELLILEEKYASDPENVFAVHYLRAQALWGLNQKQTAIEILEGMTEARPEYRAAISLLREWKEDFP